MFCDRKRIYFFTIILCSILFLSFFIPISLRRVIVSIMLCGGAFLAIYLIKKRSILSINKKQVLYIMIIIGLVYLMCYYLFGLKFLPHITCLLFPNYLTSGPNQVKTFFLRKIVMPSSCELGTIINIH